MPFYLWPFTESITDPTWKIRDRELVGGNYSPPLPASVPWTHQTWTLDDDLNASPDDPSTVVGGPGGEDSFPIDSRLHSRMHRVTLNRNSRSCGGSYRAAPTFPKFVHLKDIFTEVEPGTSYKLVKRYDLDEGKWIYVKVPLRVRQIRRKLKKPSGQLDICPLNFFETIFSGIGGSILRTGIPTLIQDPNAPPGNFIMRDLPSWSYNSPFWPRFESGPDAFVLRELWEDLPDLCDSSSLMGDYSAKIAENDLIAIRRLYSKIKDQKVDLATGLAEGAQTIRLLADIVERLAKAYTSLKKFRLSEAVLNILPSTRKKIANDFLAYRYGISPLVSDLQGSAEQLADWIAGEPRFGAKVKSKSFYVFEPDISTHFGITKRIERSVDITVRYKVVYKVDNKVMKNLDKLGFTNPANVEWELVPFSFVIDWFLPIGNFLRDLEALSFLTVQEVSKTTFIKESINIFVDAPAGAMLVEGKILETANFGASIVNTQCVRELVPTPTLPLPSFKNPLSKGHIANAIALFLQTLK